VNDPEPEGKLLEHLSIKEVVTIIIPCKDEQGYIDKLLRSISEQTDIDGTQIIIADAGSVDGTLDVIWRCKRTYGLNVEVVEGGMPSKGRNSGAKLAGTKYLLFIDADIVLLDREIIQKTVHLMESKGLDLATTNIKCVDNDLRIDVLHFYSNIAQKLSKLYKPFSTGMYMMVRNEVFRQLGGFNEDVLYGEDYYLSKQIERKRFGIVRSAVWATDRRFRKMGYRRVVSLFMKTAVKSFFSEEHFKKDVGYWE